MVIGCLDWIQSIEAMQFRELLEDLSEERLHIPYKELLQKSVDRCASSRGAPRARASTARGPSRPAAKHISLESCLGMSHTRTMSLRIYINHSSKLFSSLRRLSSAVTGALHASLDSHTGRARSL